METAGAHSVADSLANTVRFDHFFTPFHDRFAQFTVGFTHDAPMGVGRVFPRAVQGTFQVTEATLQLWLEEGGTCIAIQRQRIDSYPWLAEERCELAAAGVSRLRISARHAFLDERTLISEFAFTNASPSAVTIHPRWAGMLPGDFFHNKPGTWAEFEGINGISRETFLHTLHDSMIEGGIRVGTGKPDLPQMAVRVACLNRTLDAWVGDLPFWAQQNAPSGFTPGQGRTGHYLLGAGLALALEPGQTTTLQFAIQVAYAYYAKPAFAFPPMPPACDTDNLIQRCRQYFIERLGPPLATKTPTPLALATRLARARYALLRTGTRGLDGEFGDNIACLCTSDATPFSTVFFWDALFSSVAISDFHPEYARGAIRAAFVRQSPRDGSSPENKFNYPVPHRFKRQSPQAPIATWAVLRYLQKNPDPRFLETMYPILQANHRFFQEYSDCDLDGLAEWRWTGQTADNSPLYDQYISPQNSWIPPIASVSLNCFLYRDAMLLADAADLLCKPDDAKAWRGRATTLFQRLMEICFVPDEKRFWDYNHQTMEHRRVKTFYMFWPLFARMPVPKAIAKDLIENVLLDEKQFFGPIPFPSVAYDEPTYDPAGYWRGKAWPHISYWLLETLVYHGYAEAADAAADRIISWYSSQYGFPENMTSDPSKENRSAFDYNWGSAAFYLIARRAYRCE